MKLLFLHGAPAVGKLTVGKAVLELVPGRLFDNHAAIDLARKVFDFGAPGFWELVHAARVSVIETGAQHGLPLLVVTYCYAEPEDREAFKQFDNIVTRAGGAMYPVYLSCTRGATLQRLGNDDRRARGKLTSPQGLDDFLGQFVLSPVPHAACLALDTTAVAPAETARRIVEHFGLGAL